MKRTVMGTASQMKRWKLNDGVRAVVILLLGITLLIWPSTTTQVLGMVIGGGLFIFGVIQVIFLILKKQWNIGSQLSLIMGIIIAVIGGWIFLKPSGFWELIPLIIGVIIIINGLHNIIKSFQLKKMKYDKWWIAIILGLLTVLLGVILIRIKDSAAMTVVRIIGAFLIYDGLSDLFIVFTMHNAIKGLNVAGTEEDIIDVEGTEVKK